MPLMAPGAVLVDVPLGIIFRGLEEMMQHPHSNWAASFPDSKTEVLASYTGADWTAVEYRSTGTFTNDLTVGDLTLAATYSHFFTGPFFRSAGLGSDVDFAGAWISYAI